MVSCLIVEIGNRTVKAALTEGITIGKMFRYRGENRMSSLFRMMESERPSVTVAASRNIIANDCLKEMREHCADILVLDPEHSYILQHYGLPDNISYGRAASVIASRYLFRGMGCTVLNTGHSREIDFIAADGEYKGGVSGTKFDIDDYMASANAGNIIVFAGTEANNLAKRMKNSIFVVSNLILMGLALITDDYVKRDDI